MAYVSLSVIGENCLFLSEIVGDLYVSKRIFVAT